MQLEKKWQNQMVQSSFYVKEFELYSLRVI